MHIKARRVLVVLITILWIVTPVSGYAFSPVPDEGGGSQGSVQVGYAIITPSGTNTTGLVVFETFGEKRGNTQTQAGVLPASMTTDAVVFVSTNGRLSRNLGVAIANPGSADATLTFKLLRADGTVIATKTVVLAGKHQTAKFVTELFASEPEVAIDFTGTLRITSDVPVAMIGLRFRGENFSTLPVTNLSLSIIVPIVSVGVGGSAAVILPQFATGGGWGSEIVIVNSGTSALIVRVDLFDRDGNPLVAKLNGVSRSSFTNLTIAAGGVLLLAPLNQDGDNDF